MADNGVIKLGDGPDLLMQHTGNHNFIEGASGFSGNLYLRAKLNENGIVLISDGAVELYYDNAKKLETTSEGVLITSSAIPAAIVKATSSTLTVYLQAISRAI